MKKIFPLKLYTMKKMKIVLLVAISIFTLSCEKEQENTISSKLDLKNFEKYGKAHNNVLDYFNSFTPPENISYLNDGIDFTHNKIKTTLDKDFNFIENNEVFSFTKGLIDFRNSKNIIFTNQGQFRSQTTEQTIDEILSDVSNLGVLSNFALEKLNEIMDLSELYFNNSISTLEIRNSLNIIETELIAENYSDDNSEGRTIAIILAISNASIDWWEAENNVNSENVNNRRPLPAWAGADIAGAVVGAAHQLVVSGGDLSWSGTGGAALLGAAATSTGVVSGLGRWISNLF
jgi:hypothetical protein